MSNIGVWDTIKDANLNLVEDAVHFVPKLLIAVVLVLVGMLVARLISKLVGKVVDMIENSRPVRMALDKTGSRPIDIDSIVALFTKWAVLIIFLSAAVDVLGLAVLTKTFDSLVSFVPNILAAAVVAGLTFIASNVIYDLVNQSAQKASVKAHKTLANLARVVVMVFGFPLAAAQLGMDLTLITNNLTVIVAGIVLAFSLAFGLGGREVAGKILDDAYKNWKK
ncbi:hypothetical protein CSA80_01520 [Candidatus Saccharibacteria bacterium]|nr:MAG: hypothetical protein CSA80_01520 [Candidatus Saccharibacteria bacterium]